MNSSVNATTSTSPPLFLKTANNLWGLPLLTPEGESALQQMIVFIQNNSFRYSSSWGSARSSEKRCIEDIQKHPHFKALGPLAFMAARRIHQQGYQSLKTLENLEWVKGSEHIGQNWMGRRQSGLIKPLIQGGCHPALLFTTHWNPNQSLPTLEECVKGLGQLGVKASADAVRFIFNAFDALPNTQVAFRAAVINELLETHAKGIWTQRDGIANSSETHFVMNAAPLLERLSKKKALPESLKPLFNAVQAKLPFIKGQEEEVLFSFTPEQLQRQKGLRYFMFTDDLVVVSKLLDDCGLSSPAAFEAGCRIEEYQGMGFYWSTQLLQGEQYTIAGFFLEQGENPWLLAGDGPSGQAAKGNPFVWLSMLKPTDKKLLGYGSFAQQFCMAALRDAESREPGNGQALCIAQFEQAQKHPAWDTKKPHIAALMAAAERSFLNLLLEDMKKASEAALGQDAQGSGASTAGTPSGASESQASGKARSNRL